MQILYDITAIVLFLPVLFMFLIRATRERGFMERIRQSMFGIFPEHALDSIEKNNCIWVHAASVGEVVATSPLIKEFRREFPKSPILVSVVTASGYEMANRIIKDADSIIYYPLDFPWLAGRVLRRIHPRVFLPVETELWPNFLKTAKKLRIPVMMVNGRISDKSVKRYRHLHSMWDDMITTITKFAMQSPIDADYIRQLGAPPELVTITGNTKFDQTYTDVSEEEKEAILGELGFSKDDKIFLAGSTHRGEEDLILNAFRKLQEKHDNAKLVIAPRELLRTMEVTHIVKSAGFSVATRTKLQKTKSVGHDVVILDTIGELGKIYSIGDVIYVGKSLVVHGGHNILEPAAHGKAIIVGSNMENFKDTHALFTKRDACVTVDNAEELNREVLRLFDDEKERARLEKETLAIVNENKGAARKSAMLLKETLDSYEAKERLLHIKSTEKVENLQTYFINLVHSKDVEGFGSNVIVSFLYCFSALYSMLVNLKLGFYKIGLFHKEKLPCFVISLGNVTVGGTGKTPTAQCLAREIRDMGYRVVILNRGYRAKWHGDVGVVSDGEKLHMDAKEAGDEAFMLAKHLQNVPVLIGAERALTGRYAIEHFGAEVAILDDGYQHWQLKRDLDILLVDAVNVFGNEHILPRGTLREPISHVNRADVCLMTKVDQAAEGSIEYIRNTVHKYNENALIVESIHQPRTFIPMDEWHDHIGETGLAVSEIKGKRIMAVSAIGNPASFEQTLSDLGAIILESLRYPDHHEYTVKEMEGVFRQADSEDAEAIVITEKDAVKFPLEVLNGHTEIPVYVISVEVTFKEGASEFRDMLSKKIAETIRKG